MSQFLFGPASAFLSYLQNKQTRQTLHTPELSKGYTTNGFNRVPEIAPSNYKANGEYVTEPGCNCLYGHAPKPEIDKIGSNNFLSCNCKETICQHASKESCALHSRKMALTNPRVTPGINLNFHGSHLNLVNTGRKCHSLVGVVPDPICSNCNFRPSQFRNF